MKDVGLETSDDELRALHQSHNLNSLMALERGSRGCQSIVQGTSPLALPSKSRRPSLAMGVMKREKLTLRQLVSLWVERFPKWHPTLMLSMPRLAVNERQVSSQAWETTGSLLINRYH